MSNHLFSPLSLRTEEDFKRLYLKYFARLTRFASYYTLTKEDAENIVQDVFLKLWETRNKTALEIRVVSFLFTLVKNRCLDYLKHLHVQEEYCEYEESRYRYEIQFKLDSLERMDIEWPDEEEIYHKINAAIESLPPKCREILIKSKIEGKKYREIAEEMSLSEKTIENQIGIAIKKLRLQLSNKYILLIFMGISALD